MGIEELKNHIWDLRDNYHKTVQDLIQKAVTEGNVT